jgi:phage baseplate assembly protein W
MADVPHLAWPFKMAGRALAQVEQDSIEDVRQNVYAFLATTKGERPLSPDFGLDDPTFGPGVNTARIAAEIMDAEDGRAVVTITASGPDGGGHATVDVAVSLSE